MQPTASRSLRSGAEASLALGPAGGRKCPVAEEEAQSAATGADDGLGASPGTNWLALRRFRDACRWRDAQRAWRAVRGRVMRHSGRLAVPLTIAALPVGVAQPPPGTRLVPPPCTVKTGPAGSTGTPGPAVPSGTVAMAAEEEDQAAAGPRADDKSQRFPVALGRMGRSCE